jgi:hypothetical protein
VLFEIKKNMLIMLNKALRAKQGDYLFFLLEKNNVNLRI